MARVGFTTYLAYPAGVGMVFVSYPVVIMMFRYVMSAVYDDGARELAGYNIDSILTYVTISWLLNTFYMTPTGRTVGARVRDGQVAMDLIKPVNLMAIYFGQSLGRTVFRFAFATVPLLILFSVFAKIQSPSAAMIAPFIVAIICGYLINFLLDYMIGLVAFFIGYNNGIRWGIRMMMNLTGGMVIPLTFFPASMAKLFVVLPTQFMFFQPLQIYLGKTSVAGAWQLTAAGLAWVIFLFISAQLMQTNGVRRLSVSGG